MCRDKANNMNCRLTPNTENRKEKILQKTKKSHIFGNFGLILLIFWKKRIFLKNKTLLEFLE